MDRERPDLLPLMRRWGSAWATYARDVGVACPPALIELADAMEDVYIHIDDQHGWDLLTPDTARQERETLVGLATAWPDLADRSRMLPVFGQDGDLLLLADDGRIHAFTHDDWEKDGVVAACFDDLIDAWATGLKRPTP
jgi:hypothetical protein